MHHSTLLSLFTSVVGLSTLAVAHDLGAHDASRFALEKRCTGTIASLSDVSAAVKCKTINIKSFKVPVGKTFDLSLLDGTIVNVLGDITFATGKDWEGPLMQVAGNSITWNGNGHKMDGNGAYWWDGKGSNGGRTKPRPMFKVKISGTMSNVYLLNPPVQAFSVANKAALTISGATVDVADGNKNSKGHNTDAFDVSGSTSLTIKNSKIDNQDDCIAINDATSLIFDSNTCNGGHGISIGSIKTGKNVKGVTISNNIVTNSQQGLRIKTYVGATDASVSDVTYSGNTVTNATKYGVVIQQDYTNEGATGKASNSVSIKNVKFSGSKSTVKVGSKGQQVYVLCGSSSCSGTWDWSKLSTSGGSKGSVKNAKISGWSAT
ncbi:endo-polygalacturonase PG1 [Leucosporidium creatinivorum]|uniref:endo-polygalacturonase n=1 Tax=Leucosporidium creatinivorum TaxID=106004 RepID=A0A1Y2FYS5_9BASI|nr:endo-polygalacturonase PG1 [Leucosporidium creatinivorum]